MSQVRGRSEEGTVIVEKLRTEKNNKKNIRARKMREGRKKGRDERTGVSVIQFNVVCTVHHLTICI